jgi:hypothetical protein
VSFVGHGWRSGSATDSTVTAGANSTATVGSLNPATASRNSGIQTLTVTGTGFSATTVIYSNYSPLPTTFLSATQVRTTSFNPRPDSGTAGTIPVGVKKQSSEKLSNTVNFTAT